MKKQRTEITNENAKFILSAYRASGADAQDPTFQQALKQAARDPELGAWFSAQRDFDQLVSERLSEIKPPSNLRSAILNGMKTAQPVKRFTPRVLLAIVAVAVAAALVSLPMNMTKRPVRMLPQFQQDVAAMLTAEPVPKLDINADTFGEVDKYLDGLHAPCAPSLPVGLQNMPIAGAKTFQWKGTTVSLTCFRLPGGELLHLLVINERDLQPFQLRGGIVEISGWRMKCMRADGKLLMFMTRETADQAKQYI